MPWSTAIPVYIWAVICIPAAVLLWKFCPRNKLAAYFLAIDYALLTLFCFWVINWVMLVYWLRFLAILSAFFLIGRALYTTWYRPWIPRGTRGIALLVFSLLLLPFLTYAVVKVFPSNGYASYTGKPVLMMVPGDGMWVVVNGGNGVDGWGMNNSQDTIFGPDGYSDPSLGYSVDMTKMLTSGMLNSAGSLNSDFRTYDGFNVPVRTPCQGEVVLVEDGHPDVEIGTKIEGLGNYIVLKCVDYYVTVGGLRNIISKVGDKVRLSQFVGYMGNSAAPAIPHVHIHATLNSYGPDGTPVPILFEPFWFTHWEFAPRNHVFVR